MKYGIVNMYNIERRHNGHWFDPSTMRFFHSRLPQTGIMLADGRALFVSSERYSFDEYHPRTYSVRIQDTEGDVDTLGDFKGYPTRREATAAMLAYAKEQ